MGFVAELKRRNVIRVAIAYLVFAWLVMQVLDVVGPVLDLPRGGSRVALVLLALGFIAALIFSWVYELTPEGLKRDAEVDPARSIAHLTARKLDIAVIVLLVMAMGLFAYAHVLEAPSSAGKRAAAPAASTSVAGPAQTTGQVAEKSIAVLPFVNMSSDPEQVYFSDGISEELLNGLVKLPGLKVAGRTSSFAFRDKQDDLRRIGRSLGVGHILEGSVRKQGTRVRITAQLIKADDGFHLWSETYERDAGDIFALQDEITAAIIDALKVKLGAAALPVTAVADIDAFNLYLQARQKLARRGVANLAEARRLFEQSIARDPDYAPAHAGLGRAVSLLWLFGPRIGPEQPITSEQASQVGKHAARAALALAPDDAEAWSVLGTIAMWLDNDWKAADEAISRSLALAPNDAEIVNFAGDFYTRTLDPRSVATERRASELDPLHGVNHHDLAEALVVQGDFTAALEAAAAAGALGFFEVSPDRHFGTTLPSLIGLKRFEEAKQLIDSLEGKPEITAALALSSRLWIAGAEGDRAAEASLLQQLTPRALAGELSPAVMAFHLIQAGRPEEAAPWLQRAVAARDFGVQFPQMFTLPERLPENAKLRAAFDSPELAGLFELRRRNVARATEAKP